MRFETLSALALYAYYGSKTDRHDCFEKIDAHPEATDEVRAVVRAGLTTRWATVEGRSETCERLLWLVDPEFAADARVERHT